MATQYEKLKNLAEQGGYTIEDGKALYPKEDYIKIFVNSKGDKLSVPFDVDTDKVSGSAFIHYNDGGGQPAQSNFTQLKAYFSNEKPKEYPKVELIEGTEPAVGVGITYNMYSDRQAYTIVEVVNEKKVIARRCNVKLKESWKPEMVAGGFSAHCTNNHSQEYEYEDVEGNTLKVFTLRKNGKWYAEGENIKSYKPASMGMRKEFHDYNF